MKRQPVQVTRQDVDRAVQAVEQQFLDSHARGLDLGATCIALASDYAIAGECCDCEECRITMVTMLSIGCHYILTHEEGQVVAYIREAITRHENAVAGVDYSGMGEREMFADLAARIRAGIAPV